MKAKLFCIMAALFAAITTDAKTLVVYYSFTGNERLRGITRVASE